jgi:hypothetical protein
MIACSEMNLWENTYMNSLNTRKCLDKRYAHPRATLNGLGIVR